MIPSLTQSCFISDMPPTRALVASRDGPATGTRRGRRAARVQGQSKPEIVPPTAGSATSPAPAVQIPEPLTPQPGTDIGELREAMQLLTQLVAHQASRQEAGSSRVAHRDSTRACDFLACGPPEFFGTKVSEDPQEFVHKM